MCCRGLTPLASPGQWGFMPHEPIPSLPSSNLDKVAFEEAGVCNDCNTRPSETQYTKENNSSWRARFQEVYISEDDFNDYVSEVESLYNTLHERIRDLESDLATTEEERDQWADDCTTLASRLYGAIHCPHIVPGPGLWYANVEDLIDENPIQTNDRGEWFVPNTADLSWPPLPSFSPPSPSSPAPSSSGTPP